eukprot:GHVL01019757.1.p1 GENE.GHVL01019757.1~~GHVL01019757.1.p1  ORF type:complete len:259 (+),score=44.38 GHVL01019757.1:780-1556(+)
MNSYKNLCLLLEDLEIVKNAFLYSHYGSADIPQGFSRSCALDKGVYMLRTHITSIEKSEKDEIKKLDDMDYMNVCLHGHSQIFKAKMIITNRDYIDIHPFTSKNKTKKCIIRIIALTNNSILSKEPGMFQAFYHPEKNNRSNAPIHILELDSSSGCCPEGYCVSHFSQESDLPCNLIDGTTDIEYSRQMNYKCCVKSDVERLQHVAEEHKKNIFKNSSNDESLWQNITELLNSLTKKYLFLHCSIMTVLSDLADTVMC